MWKTPNRPNKQISQTFNDGMVTICRIEDAAQPGYAPEPEIVENKYNLRYEEQRVGVTRYYSARQAQIRIDKVIRVQKVSGINTQDIAILQTGEKYRIDQVQIVPEVYPPCLDLSLVLFEQEA